MEYRDMIAIAAILLGPVTAVSITLWSQRRKEKRDAKMRLFIALMSHRHPAPITPEWVTSLNLIDVVFADHTRVVELWHQFYDLLLTSPVNQQAATHKNLELLSEMAKVLGFRRLQQVDIDKYYYPQGYEDQQKAQAQMETQWLRVLGNTEHFVVAAKKD